MANHKRMASGGELELPQEIIHHIQSFLNGREAARTAIFNKSWYHAWSTRPNLVLNLDRFRGRNLFPEFSIKTMQRYEDLNLRIQTFRLQTACEANSGGDSFANKLIGKAMKLGAIDLDLDLWIHVDRNVSIHGYVLPVEVLRSEALTRLSASHFAIDLEWLNLNKEVTYYSNLKSVDLNYMTVKGDLFRDWISRCPCIEELTLRSLRMMRLSREEDRLDFHKLRYLCLESLDTKEILSRARFHCLKELVIRDGDHEWKDIRICSPSLEIISIYLPRGRIWNAVFHVPNIRRFVFEGSPESSLRFRSTRRREWELEFRTSCSESEPSAAAKWFSRMNRHLKMLTTISKVSLDIDVRTYINGCRYAGDGLPLSLVEKLTLQGHAPKYPAFLDNLFLMCRPKLLTIWEQCVGRHMIDEYLLEIVRKRLVEGLKECSSRDWFDY